MKKSILSRVFYLVTTVPTRSILGALGVLFFVLLFMLTPLLAGEKDIDKNVSKFPKIYDVYFRGIPIYELTIQEGTKNSQNPKGEKIYTIRKREIKSLNWLPAVSAPESAVPGNKSFRIWESLAHLPAQLKDIEGIDWSQHQAILWPDENSIYLRQTKLQEMVDLDAMGKKMITAWLWVKKDATHPMDLIIGPGDELIAALSYRLDVCLVKRGYENFTTVKQWQAPGISPARYGFRFLGRFMVPMKDGVKLATLVFLPVDGKKKRGSFPVVFLRTPYRIWDNHINLYFPYCLRGYAVVIQACRGTAVDTTNPLNRSEGTLEPSINEARDGADALDWIARQRWCNGNIGMEGSSYLAFNEFACVMARHPALKCIIPTVVMGTAFSDAFYVGGSFNQWATVYGIERLGKKILPGLTWDEIFRHRPLIEIDTFATGEDIPQLDDELKHSCNDDYWKSQNFFRSLEPHPVATLMFDGWFDDCFPGTRSFWELMQRTGTGLPQRLVIGPWWHHLNSCRKLEELSFGGSAIRDDYWILHQKWYDRFLKGIDNGVEKPVVEYFLLGENRWQTAQTWPPGNAVPEKWYFHSSGRAHALDKDGKLCRKLPQGPEPPDIYTYDPTDPAPNAVHMEGEEGFADIQSFPYDFKDIETRNDVVVYSTSPLKEDITVAGDIMAVLYASCDVKDTDWWVYLADVYPDGRSVRLTTWMLRARFRELEDKQFHVFGSNFEKEVLLSGDIKDVVRYDIRMLSIAAVFKKGHRIRIGVTNACEGYGFPNSNTGKHEAYVTETKTGTMVIHHSPDYPSHVILPILK